VERKVVKAVGKLRGDRIVNGKRDKTGAVDRDFRKIKLNGMGWMLVYRIRQKQADWPAEMGRGGSGKNMCVVSLW